MIHEYLKVQLLIRPFNIFLIKYEISSEKLLCIYLKSFVQSLIKYKHICETFTNSCASPYVSEYGKTHHHGMYTGRFWVRMLGEHGTS